MKIWFPQFYTEAHRSEERQADLVSAFDSVGVTCVPEPEEGCELCFCGSIYRAEHTRRCLPPDMPVVHYNWDLYEYMIKHDRSMDWNQYLEDLKTCTVIVVPSQATVVTTKKYTDRDSVVVLAPVKLWDIPTGLPPKGVPSPGTYALDVMRNYPWDPCRFWAERSCRILGVTLVRTLTNTPWDEFRWLVANAKILLSCYDEASTGGLTLLEGYAHGVPCLLSDSPRMGAKDYFGDRATYFNHKSRRDLSYKLRSCWYDQPKEMESPGQWVRDNFSDVRFATDVKRVFESCLNK